MIITGCTGLLELIRIFSEIMSTPTPVALPPFLRVPVEIRLIIYGYLLIDTDCKSLSVRTEHSSLYNLRKQEKRLRTRYLHIADRFRARTMGRWIRNVGAKLDISTKESVQKT